MATRAQSVSARDGRPSDGVGPRKFRQRIAFAAALALLSHPAFAQDGRGYWFELYSAQRGAPVAAFNRKIEMGPFDKVAHCYAVGALSIETLNAKNPDRDFLGRCEPGPLLDMEEMVRRATEVGS